MTPQEERLVLELHSRWGNRWSRIARRLPGRTDNEIKNYWRTHMRKMAQERKKTLSQSSPSSSNSCSPSANNSPVDSLPKVEIEKSKTSCDDGSCDSPAMLCEESEEDSAKGYSMEQIWKEIDSTEMMGGARTVAGGCEDQLSCPSMPSPVWDYGFDSLWKMGEEEAEEWLPMGEVLFPNHQQDSEC